MYKVVRTFSDRYDGYHQYNVGDTFPRKGFNVSAERLMELSTSLNRYEEIYIKEVPDPVEKPVYNKTAIKRMNKADLVSLAEENGIQNAGSMNAAELKQSLIDYFQL